MFLFNGQIFWHLFLHKPQNLFLRKKQNKPWFHLEEGKSGCRLLEKQRMCPLDQWEGKDLCSLIHGGEYTAHPTVAYSFFSKVHKHSLAKQIKIVKAEDASKRPKAFKTRLFSTKKLLAENKRVLRGFDKPLAFRCIGSI